MKIFVFSLAIFLGFCNTSFAQEVKVLKDPSTITVVPLALEGGRAVGDDCTNPIIVSVPAVLQQIEECLFLLIPNGKFQLL